MKIKIINIFISVLSVILLSQVSIGKPIPDSLKQHKDSIKTNNSAGKTAGMDSASLKNQIQIDTSKTQINSDTALKSNTAIIDSLYKSVKDKDILTNTKLFLYILLSVIGVFLFFFLFVQTLFKIFHKTKSTRQSLLLSWNLFFVVSIIWVFIVWGILAGLWNSSAFLTVIIFLFIIGLIMTITAVKSK